MRLDIKTELYVLGNCHGYQGLPQHPKLLNQPDYAAGYREGLAVCSQRL